MLDDLHALVEFAQAGSIAGAADRLFRTPSAITRQLQRLEAELGAELLDRSTKPPRLNSLGSRVLERAPIADSINAARTMFRSCYFDRQNTHEGLQCLRNYRYEVDPDTQQFSRTPLHDHFSHGADAFRYIGLMVNEPRGRQRQKQPPQHYGGNNAWMG